MIRPYYYKNTRGRRAKDIETMLRMYLMQNWFNLSDEGIEDAIYYGCLPYSFEIS
ncbi:MAG: transposase [Anaerolineaceae bacterium]|nr:transposase [Anaerolineaceae bacterium]